MGARRAGFKLLQARPLHVEPARRAGRDLAASIPASTAIPPASAGAPAARGGQLRVRALARRAGRHPGDARSPGPALSHILPRVAGVVAELGGSTSHLASLARERGIPMVLGVLDATRRIPDGAQVAVDGVAGVVRWMLMTRPRVFITQPVAKSAIARLRSVARSGQSGSEPHHAQEALIAAVKNATSCSACCRTASTREVIAANPHCA